LEGQLKTLERRSREATAKADDIEAAAYDLKAVNPNRKSEEDTRTPAELLDFIAAKGHEADAALAALRRLILTAPTRDQQTGSKA
jgi:type I restriction enzyme M protein